jgi:hypothetical protein
MSPALRGEVQGSDPREEALLTSAVIDYGEWETARSGSTYLAVFKDQPLTYQAPRQAVERQRRQVRPRTPDRLLQGH